MIAHKNRFFLFMNILMIMAIGMMIVTCGDENPQSLVIPSGGIDTISPIEVSDLSLSSPTTSSIVLIWKAPGDDGRIGTAFQYDIRYSRSAITEQNWDSTFQVSGENPPSPADQVDNFRILNLASGTKYYFALKTMDEVFNESGLSNNISGSTLQETTPPAVIIDLAATAINDTNITLTWTSPGDDGITGTAFQYDIRYSTSGINEQNWNLASQVSGEPSPKNAGQDENFTVTGLVPATNYFFAIKAADEVPNWSAISNVAPAIGYGVFLWIYPRTIRTGGEINIIYRVSIEHPIALGINRRLLDYQCGDRVNKSLVEGIYPTGIYSITYDFFDNITHNYMTRDIYFISLCWDLERKANIMVTFKN